MAKKFEPSDFDEFTEHMGEETFRMRRWMRSAADTIRMLSNTKREDVPEHLHKLIEAVSFDLIEAAIIIRALAERDEKVMEMAKDIGIKMEAEKFASDIAKFLEEVDGQ